MDNKEREIARKLKEAYKQEAERKKYFIDEKGILVDTKA